VNSHHNLPATLTSFVGREKEMDWLLENLRVRRLVTLTGVGGCGKTRLAVRAAAHLAETGSDGPWIIDLSPVTDPDRVPRLIAATLDILLEPGSDSVAVLEKQLTDRETVLVLDTCEHLLLAVAELTDRLLRSCPALRVLATSREPLGVEGETVWRMAGLPPAQARQLFSERAFQVAPRFDADSVAADIDDVCTKVDFLPLAIELAAAWVRALSPAQIAAGLGDAIRLLTQGPRGAVARHQTLRASISWSHALLEVDEQLLFERLAVFAGTFTAEAVAEVCAEPNAVADPIDSLHQLGRLLDKSLVTARDTEGEIRYRLLDTIHQFAEHELRNSGEQDVIRMRHLAHFLRVAEGAEPGLDSEQDRWRELLDSHHDNLVAALAWGFDAGAHEMACRLTAALGRYWFLRGLSSTGLDFMERALAVVADAGVRTRLLAAQACLAMVGGRADLLASAVDEVLSDPESDAVSRARCLVMRSYQVFFRDFEECELVAREARVAAEAAGDAFARDWSWVMEGYSQQTRNLHEAARASARIAHENSIARGDRFCAAFGLGINLFTTMVTGDVRAAVSLSDEVLALVRPLRDYFAVGTNSVNAGQVMVVAGDLESARRLVEPVVRSLDQAEDVDVVGFMIADGLRHLWAGDLEHAVRILRRGVRRRRDGSLDWTGVRCLPWLVGALRRLGQLETALASAEEGVRLARHYRAPFEETLLLDELALLTVPGDPARARDLLHQSLVRRTEFGLTTYLTHSLEALAGLDVEQEVNLPRAARLFGASQVARERMGYPVAPADRTTRQAVLDTLRSGLDNEFDDHLAVGRTMSLNDAVTLAQRGRGSRDRPIQGWESLSPTEREVVELVTAGLSNPEVAARLFMSRSTVKTHLSRVYQKLGVANRTELAAFASKSPAHGSA
jgi:predicted ATPase/DNA-binding CsgD family transcriptional regulator